MPGLRPHSASSFAANSWKERSYGEVPAAVWTSIRVGSEGSPVGFALLQ